MAKEKQSGQEPYAQVVERLQQIVEALEAGELSLEESLERFAEGITLVKQGEKLLTDAEKRIEQLIAEDGRTAPLKVPEAPEAPSMATPLATRAVRRATLPPEDDDVPF